MIVLNRVISKLNKSYPAIKIFQLTYLGFIICLALFSCTLLTLAVPIEIVGVVFFLWAGMFTILSISLFWSLVSFYFNPTQSTQFFGIIAAGGTLGQIFGSFLTRAIISSVGTHGMLAIAGCLLLGSLLSVTILFGREHGSHSSNSHSSSTTIGNTSSDHNKESHTQGSHQSESGFFASLWLVVKSPLLFNICLHIMLFSSTASLLYFRKQQLLLDSFAESDSRTGFRASLSGAIGISTLLLQLFGTSRIISTFGLSVSISVLPLITFCGFLWLLVAPSIESIAYILFFRKVLAFSLDKPSRECLYTLVNPKDRLVVKNLIDTVIYRVGDVLGASLFSMSVLTASTSTDSDSTLRSSDSAPLNSSFFQLPSLEAIALLACTIWLCVGLWLGFEWRHRQTKSETLIR